MAHGYRISRLGDRPVWRVEQWTPHTWWSRLWAGPESLRSFGYWKVIKFPRGNYRHGDLDSVNLAYKKMEELEEDEKTRKARKLDSWHEVTR